MAIEQPIKSRGMTVVAIKGYIIPKYKRFAVLDNGSGIEMVVEQFKKNGELAKRQPLWDNGFDTKEEALEAIERYRDRYRVQYK